MRRILLLLLALCATLACAQENVTVVGNPAQPVQHVHRSTIQAAINLACSTPLPGEVDIPFDYPGTDTYVNTCGALVFDLRVGPSMKPLSSDAVQWVSPNGNDLNDGRSWGTAKLTLGAAIAALPGTGYGVVRTTGFSLSTGVTIARASTVIACEPGAVITYSGTGRFIFTSSNDGIQDCTLKGAATGTQAVVWDTGGTNGSFLDNTVSGFNGGGSGILEIVAGSNYDISGNTFSNNSDIDIAVNGVYGGTTISGVRIARNVASEIMVHTSTLNASVNAIVISHNRLTAGENGKVEFCVEAGAFGGNIPSDVVVADNTCAPVANNDGGYSLSSLANGTLAANAFNGNGTTSSVAAYELALCSHCTAVGNVASNQIGGSGITLDRAIDSTAVGNSISGFGTAGIFASVSSTTSPTLSGNTVSGNTVIFPPAGTGTGIWQQCNATGAACQNNIYTGNTIISDGTAGSRGIVIENDLGTTSGILVQSNNLKTPATLLSGIANWGSANGTVTLTSGSGSHTFGAAYDLAPICTAVDTTSAAAVKATSSVSAVTLTGTGSDVIAWSCAPAAN